MAAEAGDRRRSWQRLIVAAIAALASLAASAFFLVRSAAEAKLSSISVRALVLVDNPRLPADSDVLARAALFLDPLNQNALNIAYVNAVRRGIDPARLARFRNALARLGWRSTAAQQNLLAAAVERSDFQDVMNRVDGLLRRNRFVTELDPFMAAAESDPQTRAALVDKLRADPPWRELLLVRGGELHGAARLTDRATTMQALLDRGAKLSRVEVSPFLVAATAGSEWTPAYRLWARTLRQPTPGGLLYDGDFKIAAVQGVRPPLPVPFEWKFENGDGYTTQVGSDGGLFIRWSGRGVPLLLSQPFRAPAGVRGYRLQVATDPPSVPIIADKLAFALSCDDRAVVFQPSARTLRSVEFTIGALPCAMPKLSLSGRLQDVAEPMTATINKVQLTAR